MKRPDLLDLILIVAAILLAVTICLFSSGCSHRMTGPETEALSGHLERASTALSRADGKAVVIESWLRAH